VRRLAVFAGIRLGQDCVYCDPFAFGFLNFFERAGIWSRGSRHTRFTSARHAQSGERNVDHFFGGDGGHVLRGRFVILDAAGMLRTTSRAAERATSMATLPPPITITFLPMVNL